MAVFLFSCVDALSGRWHRAHSSKICGVRPRQSLPVQVQRQPWLAGRCQRAFELQGESLRRRSDSGHREKMK